MHGSIPTVVKTIRCEYVVAYRVESHSLLQYLKNEELHDPPDGSTNPWVDFLEHNPKLQGEDTYIEP